MSNDAEHDTSCGTTANGDSSQGSKSDVSETATSDIITTTSFEMPSDKHIEEPSVKLYENGTPGYAKVIEILKHPDLSRVSRKCVRNPQSNQVILFEIVNIV